MKININQLKMFLFQKYNPFYYPEEAYSFNRINICENCAWTPDPRKWSLNLDQINDKNIENNNPDFKNIAKYKSGYYCYYYGRYFYWIRSGKEGVFHLAMKPCIRFTDKPPNEDLNVNRGSKFAQFFLYKSNIDSSDRRSWLAIIISLIAVTVSGYKIIIDFLSWLYEKVFS